MAHSVVAMRVLVLLGVVSTAVSHAVSPLSLVHPAATVVANDASIQMTVEPALIASGENVTVVVANVANPSLSDWIGVYSPANVDVSLKAPVKYQFAAYDPSYLSTGKATIIFNMLAMRSDSKVVFFRGGTSSPVEAASAGPVQFTDVDMPTAPRLMYTGSPNELRFMWISNNASPGHFTVWPTNDPASKRTYTSSVSTFTADEMCGAPATTVGYRNPGSIHSVVFPIQYVTKYTYTFGSASGAAGTVSLPRQFQSPVEVGPHKETHLLAFGDMGKKTRDDSLIEHDNPGPLNTTRLMGAEVQGHPGYYSGLLHIGDISYARGYNSDWDLFFDEVQEVSAGVPYHVCLGNHEMDFPGSASYWQGTDSGGECGVPTEKYFISPHAGKGKHWYSVDIGSVHVVFMSTEHNFTTGSEQWRFLAADLAAVDRTVTPWVIFAGHRPMYIDSTNNEPPAGDQPVARLLRADVEILLMKYKVDLAIWGHHHSYQRMCAVYGEKCLQQSDNGVYRGPWKAPVQMVIGMAGAGLSQNIKPVPDNYVEYVNDQTHGYTRMHAFNETHFQLEFIRDIDGQLDDEMWIIRDSK